MMASVCSWPAPLACLVIRKPLRFWPKARSEAKTRQGPSFAQQKFFAPCPLRLVLSECGGAKGGEAAPRPNRMRGSNCKRLWPKAQICERMFSLPSRNRTPRQPCQLSFPTASSTPHFLRLQIRLAAAGSTVLEKGVEVFPVLCRMGSSSAR